MKEKGEHSQLHDDIVPVGIRYIVNNVDDAIEFYTEILGFEVEKHPAPGFAALTKGHLKLILNQPGFGGAGQALQDGKTPQPGGWNRIQLQVKDIESIVGIIRTSHGHIRNQIVKGQGGRQILLEDPSGNLVELFEPNA